MYKEIPWLAAVHTQKGAHDNEEVKIKLCAYHVALKERRGIEEVTLAFRVFNTNYVSKTSSEMR